MVRLLSQQHLKGKLFLFHHVQLSICDFAKSCVSQMLAKEPCPQHVALGMTIGVVSALLGSIEKALKRKLRKLSS